MWATSLQEQSKFRNPLLCLPLTSLTLMRGPKTRDSKPHGKICSSIFKTTRKRKAAISTTNGRYDSGKDTASLKKGAIWNLYT